MERLDDAPGTTPTNPPEAPEAPSSAPPGVGAGDVPTVRVGALWASALIAGLVGGAAAWLIGEAAHEFFEAELVSTVINGREGKNSTFETRNVATVQNAMLIYGALGAILGLALGVGGGLSRRSARSAAIAGLIGLIAGGAAGVAAPAAILPTVLQNEAFQEDNLLRPFLIHAGDWVPLGIAAGLAFGLGAGLRRGALLAAAIGGGFGALLGTGANELIGGAAFPFARTDRAFSLTAETRLIARMCVALGTAAGAAIGAADRRPTRLPPS